MTAELVAIREAINEMEEKAKRKDNNIHWEKESA